MAKKKKTRRGRGKSAASDLMSVVADDHRDENRQPGEENRKPEPEIVNQEPEKRKPERYQGTCGTCHQRKEIAWADCDPEWELPGHPDHYHRNVCRDCASFVDARTSCASRVYEAMREQLANKGMNVYEIENAVDVAWRTFEVSYDHEALEQFAKRLKVKHPWLKMKRPV